MTIEERLQQLYRLAVDLPYVAESELNNFAKAEGGAVSIVTFIKNRVQTKEEKASGGKFGTYSEKKLPTFFFHDKGTKQVTFTKEEKRDGISYAEFRRKLGKTNKNKNFDLTGDTWLNFTSKGQATRTQQGATIDFGGQTQTAQNKIDWNSDREKESIINMSEKERQFFEKQLANGIEKYLKQIFE